MRAFLRNIWQSGIVGNLLTGSLVLLPLVVTVVIINWIVGTIGAIFGPSTWFGDMLTKGGGAIIGKNRELISFLVGAGFALSGIWLLGLIVRTRARRALGQTLDNALAKVPLFRAVYRPVSQVVRMLTGSDAGLASMSVVMCRLGGDGGVDVPALLASQQVYGVGGDRRLLVYLPTSPLPAWGGLVLVPAAAVVPVPGMDAEGLIKLYFSFGVLAPEIIPPRTEVAAPATRIPSSS